ncbi:MAG: MSCRAMM family adhesin SdrC [Anaerolineae bacterium]|nr:MSCRAMM family adhesin SdrC [Anaerolineae bacterium]
MPAGHNPPNDREFSIGNLVSTPWDIPIKVNLLGGMVFRDHDISGTYSETIDTLYADVVLILSDADGIPLTATMTDENGQYAFQALADGDYTITVDQGFSLDLGWISDPQSKTRTVTVNTLYRSIDFAAQPPVGAVNGLVFADLNDNGTFDPTIEYALEGIDVKLTSLLNGSEFMRC